jgi:hypothetical protein
MSGQIRFILVKLYQWKKRGATTEIAVAGRSDPHPLTGHLQQKRSVFMQEFVIQNGCRKRERVFRILQYILDPD